MMFFLVVVGRCFSCLSLSLLPTQPFDAMARTKTILIFVCVVLHSSYSYFSTIVGVARVGLLFYEWIARSWSCVQIRVSSCILPNEIGSRDRLSCHTSVLAHFHFHFRLVSTVSPSERSDRTMASPSIVLDSTTNVVLPESEPLLPPQQQQQLQPSTQQQQQQQHLHPGPDSTSNHHNNDEY